MERVRVLLLSPRIGGGGAQQVMVLLARGLPREKFEVHLALLRSGENSSTVPSWVAMHPLNSARARAAVFPLLRLVWRLRPDVIVSGAPEISFLILLLRPFLPRGTRVLVRQNSTVSNALNFGGVPRYTRTLYRLLYPRAGAVICQSAAMADDLAREIGIAREKIAVLPNPVDLEGILAAQNVPAEWIGQGPHLLAVGRLAPEKGFDLLIEALAEVRRKFPFADLTIAGSGREKGVLDAAIQNSRLGGAVRILESLENPYALFPGATVFVLSSRYEGMPNALLEAAAAGLPIVATPASGGVVEFLSGREGAWLATESSSKALADALILALRSFSPGQRYRHETFPSGAAKAAR